ncbi:chemotaxis protein CheD [Maritimibacter sp. DP07]|uniref:Probable chemoreceptor glutamine deamidase CheD n=1 Tax=Maritimibacter harenae TaxID=2606218 RepID=A0A845M9M8_9RHOB|nr:chemotaxis protein CheD [Maritimibacter harenae]MZR13221.1 chemotaxis protein CheD [Maritimibacter harenae]
MSSLEARKSGRTYIAQGEHAIDGGPDAVIATLLGSCVAACIWDPGRGIGGMNHVLFVDATASSSMTYGYGVNAMELLINGLLRLGAERRALRAKVFGGARMIDGLSDGGSRNAEFVQHFLAREGISEVGSDIGGTKARRVEFWPGTGRARLKYVRQTVPVVSSSLHRKTSRDIELF